MSESSPISSNIRDTGGATSGGEALPSVAMVGCGYWGKNVARNLASLGTLIAVCDVDRDAANSIATAYGIPELSWIEVLDAQHITAVALATPAEMHGPMAMQAMEAGKDVFVEKPLAMELADAHKLLDMSRGLNRILMVGHLLQYHPAFITLNALVKAGEIGRLQYVYSTRLNLGKIRREEDILWSFAPHDISMILTLGGEAPSEVRAIGSNFLHGQIADSTITHLRFPGGLAAHIFVSWLHPFKEQRLVVVGDRGMLVFDDMRAWGEKLARFDHEIRWVDGMPRPVKADATFIEIPEDEPLKQECQHFVDCIQTRQVPRTDGAEGLQVLSVLKDASASLKERSESAVASTARSRPRTFVHESAYIDTNVDVGDGTKIWHFSHILSGSSIGANCVLGQNVMVGPAVTVGRNCKIQNNVSLYKGVTLEDGVFCGPSCVFTNVNNPRAEIERKDEFRTTLVGRGATIGANATIICGNNIGAYSFVGAGAVVTRDVPEFAMVAGVPARRIGWVSHDGEILGADLTCPRSGRRYRAVGDEMIEEIPG